MAVRRPQPLCLSCQARQATTGRRRFSITIRRHPDQINVNATDGGFPLLGEHSFRSNVDEQSQYFRNGRQFSQIPPDMSGMEAMLLDLNDLSRTSACRAAILRKLSNPVTHQAQPEPPQKRAVSQVQSELTSLLEVHAGLIPHPLFRRMLRESIHPLPRDKLVRKVLRAQLLRCELPSDILRVVAAAMQHAVLANHLASLSEPLTRALYRCRAKATDPHILSTLDVVISRLRIAGLPVAHHLLTLGLRFASRARSLERMKRLLRLVRESGKGLTSNTFRSIIAKFSIGARGLGEIRNGRWRREQLQQVLNGFVGCEDLPPDKQYHLGTFLDRDDWAYLHAWVAVIARCKDSEAIWREWEAWKGSDARRRPKRLARMIPDLTSRIRGEYWFVEQMAFTGDGRLSWRLLEETGISFSSLQPHIAARLLRGVEWASQVTDEIRAALLALCKEDLGRIERELGVRWVRGTTSGTVATEGDVDGVYEQIEELEDVLERLGADEWQYEETHGFPIDESEFERSILSRTETALHHAEEKGLAELPLPLPSKPNPSELGSTSRPLS